jgi:hypothetical protein
MPKTKIDYSKTIIYKIINYDFPDLLYVGSTTNFTKRKQNHKERCSNVVNKSHDYKIYKTIRENGEWESWNMIKICDYPCNNKREAEQEEDRYMMELKANMNMRRAFQTNITRQEYFDNRKNIKSEYDKQRRTEKRDEINQKKNEAYHRDKEKNKEKIKEAYLRNKDNYTQLITCNCGVIMQRRRKASHEKTIKHQKYLNTIE